MFMNMTKTVILSTGLQNNIILVSAFISVKTNSENHLWMSDIWRMFVLEA